MTYENSRPHIPAEIERQIKTEAGHKCTVKHCNEHIAEIHHIDGNRENNVIDNLIYLCDKHHKLAHSGNISRQDLREYKKLLSYPQVQDISCTRTDHDFNLLQKINNLFPYNLIQELQNEPFRKVVPRRLIYPINDFLDNADDPLWNFMDLELEGIRIQVVNSAKLFIKHFQAQSGGCENPDYYEFIDLKKCVSGSYDYWDSYSLKTNELARAFCNGILALRDKSRNY